MVSEACRTVVHVSICVHEEVKEPSKVAGEAVPGLTEASEDLLRSRLGEIFR